MKTKQFQKSLLWAVICLLAMASCKAPKTLTTTRLKPISTNKLIRNVEENIFDYESFDIKRISCQYETSREKVSFRASLESVKDKYILVSLSKINLPVAKLLLTPDSVKMINYFEKTFSVNDYSSLNKFFNANIDFNVIQSILTNDIFSYRDDPRDQDFREFVTYTDSGMYVLQSLKNRKLERIERKRKEEKIERYLKKLDEENMIIQSLYIDPVHYKIRRIVLDDRAENRILNINFSEFQAIDNYFYPGDIHIRFKGPGDFVSLKIKLGKFSTQTTGQNFSFKVPERYKRVN
ncbi:MAG: DUF4292 domain-containing protein [Mangrovibacterium sp.]